MQTASTSGRLAGLGLAFLGAISALAAPAKAQHIYSYWLEDDQGNWDRSRLWSTHPRFPSNGQPAGYRYTAIFDALGANYQVSLPLNITLDGIALRSPAATVRLATTLTLNDLIEIDAGRFLIESQWGRLEGGSLVCWPGGQVEFGSTGGEPTLSGVSLFGEIGDGSDVVSIANDLFLAGTLRASVNVPTSQTIFGGTIAWDAPASTGQIFVGEGQTLTLSPDTVVRGGGTSSSGARLGDPREQGVPASNSIINEGLIAADTAGRSITIFPADFTNQGVVRAANGGTLYLGRTELASPPRFSRWTNLGTIELGPASTLVLNGDIATSDLGAMTRTGGTIVLTGRLDNTGQTLDIGPTTWGMVVQCAEIIGGTLDVDSLALQFESVVNQRVRLRGVTILGDVQIDQGNAPFTITDGLTLGGQLRVQVPGVQMRFEGEQTLAGGELRSNLASSGTPTLVLIPAAAELTLAPDATISGRYLNVGGDGALVNHGAIRANVAVFSNDRSIYISDQVAFLNLGLVEAAGGGIFEFQSHASVGNIDLTAGTLTGGVWRVSENSMIRFVSNPTAVITTNNADVALAGASTLFPLASGLAVNNGAFRLDGGRDFSTTAGLVNAGLLDLGIGSDMNVSGSYTSGPAAVFEADIFGITPGSLFGRAVATGPVAIDGTLRVRIANPNFNPIVGQQWDLVRGSTRTGTFHTLDLPTLGATLRFDVQYLPDRVRLVVVPLP